ncbi:MAG TPA: NAD(P)H-hydrate dehydratase [Candidatus Poseidoniales archaeon]|nr:MAG TPA: NAD(P)H-hydrate dehydratase [Candidatus Poseidoniales archaeon]
MPEVWHLDPSEVAVIDANAVAMGVDMDQLMIRAAQGLRQCLQPITGHVWILCGPGNNGGDGFRLAMMLEDCSVIVSHQKQKTSLSERARNDCNRVMYNSDSMPNQEPTVIVDCLLGAGCKGELRAEITTILQKLPPHIPILSCDIPTGCGSIFEVKATKTVSFISAKTNMYDLNGQIRDCVGELIIDTLDLDNKVLQPGPGDLLRYPPFEHTTKKGHRGRVLIIGGGPYHGAPIFSGLAAMRTGVDLVHVAMPQKAAMKIKWPASLIHESIADEEIFTNATELVERFCEGRGVQSVVIGPGLGKDKQTLEAVRTLTKAWSHIPFVIDADAISAFNDWPTNINGVFTPHEQEWRQWLGDERHTINTLQGHGTSRCVVVTGFCDKIFSGEGRQCEIDGGHPRMAMGGTGDMLAGMIGGFLALGINPWGASRLACWTLREAGRRAVDEFGPGMLPDDVIPFISKVLKHH